MLGTPNLLGSCWLVAALHHWEGEGGGKGVGIGAVTVFDSSGFANSEGGVQVSFLVEVV